MILSPTTKTGTVNPRESALALVLYLSPKGDAHSSEALIRERRLFERGAYLIFMDVKAIQAKTKL